MFKPINLAQIEPIKVDNITDLQNDFLDNNVESVSSVKAATPFMVHGAIDNAIGDIAAILATIVEGV